MLVILGGQALARLRFCEVVSKEDVDEALRLTHMSKARRARCDRDTLVNYTAPVSLKASLMDDDYLAARDRLDPTSRIYAIIRDYVDLHQVPRAISQNKSARESR